MKPICQLIGKNGNVFNLIGLVRKTLKEEKLDAELKLFDTELEILQQNGGTYDDVLNLFLKYVEII